MKTYQTTLTYGTPVIFNALKKEIMDEYKQLKKNEMEEWEETRWQEKAYYDDDGNAIVPAIWIKPALREACIKTGMVPYYESKKTARYATYVQGFYVENTGPPLCSKDELECFGSFVNSQGKSYIKKRVYKNRPMKQKGTVSFLIHDPEGRMKKDELEKLFNYIGRFIGLSDNRVNGYGRFSVDSVEEVDTE